MIEARAFFGRFAGRALLWLCAAAAVVPVAAQQAGSAGDSFAAGEAAFAEGDYGAALESFERARDLGADGAAIHYNIGVTQYRLGRFAAAAETFRMISGRFPRMRDVADYNLGLALVEQNRTAEARSAFARALESDDDKIARLATAMLERIGPAREPEPRSLVAVVDLAAGHDDNVALIDELSVPAAAFPESAFLEAVGFVEVPFGERDRLSVEATGYLIEYNDASSYDQLAGRTGFDYRALDGAQRLTLGPYYERNTLGGDGFERRFGVEAEFATRVGARGVISVNLAFADIDALETRYDFVAGDQQRLRLGYRRTIAGGVFSARYEREDNDRAAASVSAERDRVRLGWRRRIGARWQAGIEAGYRESDYAELATPRTEKRRRLGFDAARDIGGDWQLTGSLRITDNEATDPVYAYEREVLSVGLRKVF